MTIRGKRYFDGVRTKSAIRMKPLLVRQSDVFSSPVPETTAARLDSLSERWEPDSFWEALVPHHTYYNRRSARIEAQPVHRSGLSNESLTLTMRPVN